MHKIATYWNCMKNTFTIAFGTYLRHLEDARKRFQMCVAMSAFRTLYIETMNGRVIVLQMGYVRGEIDGDRMPHF